MHNYPFINWIFQWLKDPEQSVVLIPSLQPVVEASLEWPLKVRNVRSSLTAAGGDQSWSVLPPVARDNSRMIYAAGISISTGLAKNFSFFVDDAIVYASDVAAIQHSVGRNIYCWPGAALAARVIAGVALDVYNFDMTYVDYPATQPFPFLS